MKVKPASRTAAVAGVIVLGLIAQPSSSLAAETAADRAKKGLLRTISGATGKSLGKIKGLQRGDEFASDLGADSLPDLFRTSAYLMGAPGADDSAGRIWAIGSNGRPAFYHLSGAALRGGPVARFGHTILDAGHIGGDTPVHWVIGAPGTGAGGPDSAVVIVHEVDDRLGERLRVEAPPEARLGFTLAAAEDDREDSIVDHFVTGAPGTANGDKAAAGALHRISSLDGTPSWTLLGKQRNQHLGYALTITPDEDGDDVWEVVAGAPGNGKRAGVVYVVSGATGRILRSIDAPPGAGLFGFSIVRSDIDGDSIDELVVGAPTTDGTAGAETGAVYAFSGVDQSLVWSREGEEPGQWLGVAVNRIVSPDPTSNALVVSSLFTDEPKPRKNRRGGIDVYSLPGGERRFQVRGKKGGDRMGWIFVRPMSDEDDDGFTDILVGLPRAGEPFIPD